MLSGVETRVVRQNRRIILSDACDLARGRDVGRRLHFFKPRLRLEAENLFLRHQLTIALRRAPPRLRLRSSDRALLIWMTRIWPGLLGVTHPSLASRWLQSLLALEIPK